MQLDGESVIGGHYMAGRTFPALGRFRESAAHLRKARDLALAVGDSNRAAWADIYLAMGQAVRGDQEARITTLRRAAAFWPGDVPYFMLGAALAAAGDTAGAGRIEAVLRGLAENDPTNRNRRSLTKLQGARAFHAQDLDRAVALLKECPLDLDARLMLGRAHAAAGDLDAARAEFQYVVDNRFHAFIEGLVTIWPLAYYYLGVADHLAGDETAAQENLGRFATLWGEGDPGSPELEDARLRLAELSIGE
jgi:tetratricopeptide (TPR) repeat protein